MENPEPCRIKRHTNLENSGNSMFTSCKWHCAKAEEFSFISFLLFRIADEEHTALGGW